MFSRLSVLKDSELLYERGVFPQSSYIFKHALTREVVYESILATKRKKLHEKIGNAIQDLYKGNLHEYYEVLTENYSEAENYHKAAEYSKLSGKKAASTASVTNAIAFAHRTLDYLEKLPRSDELESRIVEARTALGLYYAQLNDFRKAKEAIDPVLDLAVQHNLKGRLARIYNILASYYSFVEAKHKKGIEYFKQAIKISEEVDDLLAFTQGKYWLGVELSLVCQFDQASQCFEKALSVSVAANSVWGISITKCNWAYFTYYHQGNLDKAYEISKEAIAIAEENADIFTKSWACLAYGCSCYGKGLMEDALKYFWVYPEFPTG